MPQPKTAVIVTLGVLGWLISYAFFFKWLGEHQWAFFGGWYEAFTSSDFATGLLMDLVLTTAMLVALAIFERERLGPRWTAAVILSLALSVSISLTLYLVATWLRRRDEPGGAPAAGATNPSG
ncbi:MAG TPA: hypothetical protein DEA08_12280 [Planctomycetes bacterium]|nr:hypothetical protein [Planctomycetota bacterium]